MAEVADPEIPVLTIAELGVLREVVVEDGAVEVRITPTYSGCPAMSTITLDIELALAKAGIPGHVRQVLSPAWTTDWLTEAGRQKLRAARETHLAGVRAMFLDLFSTAELDALGDAWDRVLDATGWGCCK